MPTSIQHIVCQLQTQPWKWNSPSEAITALTPLVKSSQDHGCTPRLVKCISPKTNTENVEYKFLFPRIDPRLFQSLYSTRENHNAGTLGDGHEGATEEGGAYALQSQTQPRVLPAYHFETSVRFPRHSLPTAYGKQSRREVLCRPCCERYLRLFRTGICEWRGL